MYVKLHTEFDCDAKFVEAMGEQYPTLLEKVDMD